MTETNIINKIYINDEIKVNHINISTLAFNSGKVISKANFSILDNYVNVLEPIKDNLSVYIYKGEAAYYEYKVNLKNSGVVISGRDKFGNTPTDLANRNVMVFVEGYKLLDHQFEINGENNSITILNKYPTKELSSVIIYASQGLAYLGNPTETTTWDERENTFEITDSGIENYLFFHNGELISREAVTFEAPKVKLNVSIRPGIDAIEYYRAPNDGTALYFAEEPGYFSYGPRDNFQVEVPEIYDAIVDFSMHIARLAIDDLRPGFFIKEEEGEGCVIVIDKNYETKQLKCLTLKKFSKVTAYSQNEFYIEVPQARSILKYVSEFDLKTTLFPELLGSFQRTLLDETYDSIQRIKNIRSINKVDSQNINQLINFLGLKLNITNMTLEEKHALLEELTNFYKIVGTKESYNFYNVTTNSSRIMKLEQLFTPIKDVNNNGDLVQRYVTFRTAEELGAKYKREYIYPTVDYGDVGTLANPTDSLTNTPRFEGILEDPERPPVLGGTCSTFEYNLDGEFVEIERPVRPNIYITMPVQGPNKPSVDYGFIDEDAESFIDYGYVDEEIKGHWIEWFEWNRPTNWYPTNHVDVSVEIPPAVDYDTFMAEFKKTFYDIASTVLYIHNIIDVYVFGDDKMWEESKAPNFGIMTASLYHSTNFVFTNNPTITAFIPV